MNPRCFLALALGSCLLLSLSVQARAPVYVTRGAFVTQLYELSGAEQPTAKQAAFLDVDSQSPHFAAVTWAKQQKISSGYAGGWFRPEVLVTREQAAAMLYRYRRAEMAPLPESDPLAHNTDQAQISVGFRPAVSWAVDSGLWFSGSGENLLPRDCVTAEESELLMERLSRGGMKVATWAMDLNANPAVTMEMLTLSATGATFRLHNQTEEAGHYGANYQLYRKVNGGWYSLNDDMSTILILYSIAPQSTQDGSAQWEHLLQAGTLSPGQYRLVKEVTVGESPCLLATDFSID